MLHGTGLVEMKACLRCLD